MITHTIPALLRPGVQPRGTDLSAARVIPLIVIAGAIYGAVLGSFGGMRWTQICYSAIKVPCLLIISFILTVPRSFILNTLSGVRDDYKTALRAAVTAQAGLAIMLAALGPFVALWYASCNIYSWAVLFNGGMFAISTMVGQVLLRRYYKPLIARDPRHRKLMIAWTVVYAFIAIQMAWVLRPFVGEPGKVTTFFRNEAWGNAYLKVAELISSGASGSTH